MHLKDKIIKFILKQNNDLRNHGTKALIKKFYLLIKFIPNIPFYILALPICFFIRLISPFIIIRIQKIPCANFGNFVSFVSLYYCKKKLNIEQPGKKHIDLFYFHQSDKIYNKQLAKMWKRKLIFFSSYVLNPIDNINKIFSGAENYAIEILSTKLEYDIENLAYRYPPLEFTNDEEIYGKKILSKFGLSEKDKFVCLAVRDGAYSKIKNSSTPDPHNDFRNNNIDNFVLACEELVERGYYIFRMGVVAEKPLDLGNPKIIDYANSNLRSDFMDIYLGAKCSFCISTGYGFDYVPYIFGKPIALASLPLADLRTHSDRFLLLTKHHFSKKKKRNLSLSEIFSYGAAFDYDTKNFEKKGIELIDYSPEQIRDLAIEMVDIVEQKKQPNQEDEQLQKIFKDLFSAKVKSGSFQEQLKKTRYLKLHGEIRASFSTKFLRENKNWLN